MFPGEKPLLHLSKKCSFFLICQVPDRYTIFQWLIDAKEQIDNTLSIGVAEVISVMPFDTRD